jgi:hypothetical protein
MEARRVETTWAPFTTARPGNRNARNLDTNSSAIHFRWGACVGLIYALIPPSRICGAVAKQDDFVGGDVSLAGDCDLQSLGLTTVRAFEVEGVG